MVDEKVAERKITDDLIRALWMLLFFIAARVVAVIVCGIGLFQFACTLITRRANENVARFGNGLSLYASEIIQYLSYHTETQPWPFSKWPGEPLPPVEDISDEGKS